MRYAIVGAGAIGLFYGSKLVKAGNEVHFLFHSDYNHVKTNGLQIESVLGNFNLTNVNAYANANQMPKCDVVIVCLKTTQNHLLPQLLEPIVNQNSTIVLIQNGLNQEPLVAQHFATQNIVGAMAFICSNKIGPGHIRHLEYGKLTLGIFQGQTNHMQQLCTDLQTAGIETDITPDLIKARWKKLVWNIPYNGLSVALNTTTDQLMQNPHTRALVYDLMCETIAAANACGCNIKPDFADKMMHNTDQMKPYLPSMRLDFDNHRPLEIQAIYAEPINSAFQAGFDMKKTKMLMQQLQFIQANYMQ